MSNSYPVEYKGTAFGDPARSASSDMPNTQLRASALNDKTSSRIVPHDQVETVHNYSTYPVAASYKGTAFGDPALSAGSAVVAAPGRSFKGSRFDLQA